MPEQDYIKDLERSEKELVKLNKRLGEVEEKLNIKINILSHAQELCNLYISNGTMDVHPKFTPSDEEIHLAEYMFKNQKSVEIGTLKNVSQKKAPPKEYSQIVFIENNNISQAMDTFNDIMESKQAGIVFTESDPSDVSKMSNVEYYWFSNEETPGCIKFEEIDKLFEIINKFMRTNYSFVILIHSLHRIKQANRPKEFSFLITSIKKLMQDKECNVIFAFDSTKLNKEVL